VREQIVWYMMKLDKKVVVNCYNTFLLVVHAEDEEGQQGT
jgi:hypothetical protein